MPKIVLSTAVTRGIFHVCGGLTIMTLSLLIPIDIFLVLAIAGTLLFFIFEVVRLKIAAVNSLFYSYCRPVLRDEEVSRLTGASYMFIAALLLFLLFEKEIAVIAMAFLAIGDPLATVVGTFAGRIRLFGKSLEGHIACLLACIVIGLICYFAGFSISLVVILVGAIVATIAEALELPINDNLTIPLFSAGAMTFAKYLITAI
jgi:dolichol kinase